MNTKYLKKNPSLIKLIEPTFENIKQIFEEIPNDFISAYKDLLRKLTKSYDLQKSNEIFINSLNKEQFLYCVNNYDFFFKHIENRTLFILNHKYLQENPNEFKLFLKRTNLFASYNIEKTKNFEKLILKMDNDLQSFVLNDINKDEHKKIMLNFISNRNNILYPTNEMEYEKTINFLNKIKIIPEENFINEDILKNFKDKIEKEDENIIEKLLSKPILIKKSLKLLTEEKQKELFDKLTKENLLSELVDLIDKKNLFRITKTMSYEELEKLKLSKETAKECFINNISENLYLIGFVDEETIRLYFNEIKNSLYRGRLIGKQGLKYFVVKNREKIDKDLAQFILSKYPKFYNSLKLNFDVQCCGSRKIKEFNLNKLIFKKGLNDAEKEFLKENIEKIMEMYLKDNFNEYTLNLIKKELNNE